MSRSSFTSARKGKSWPRRMCPRCGKSVAWMTSGFTGHSHLREHHCPHGTRCTPHVDCTQCKGVG